MARSPILSPADVAATHRGAVVANANVVLVWRLVLVVAAVVGILLLPVVPSLVFFTIQSNLLLAAVFGYDVITMVRKKPLLPLQIKGAVTLYILITGLVYNIILAPATHLAPGTLTVPLIGGTPRNDLLHILTPILALVDWLLFDAHVALRWRTALFWLSYPLAYMGFILIRGVLINAAMVPDGGTRYPYGFINVDHLGYGGVALNMVIYGFAFWLLGCALIAINHWLARRKSGV